MEQETKRKRILLFVGILGVCLLAVIIWANCAARIDYRRCEEKREEELLAPIENWSGDRITYQGIGYRVEYNALSGRPMGFCIEPVSCLFIAFVMAAVLYSVVRFITGVYNKDKEAASKFGYLLEGLILGIFFIIWQFFYCNTLADRMGWKRYYAPALIDCVFIFIELLAVKLCDEKLFKMSSKGIALWVSAAAGVFLGGLWYCYVDIFNLTVIPQITLAFWATIGINGVIWNLIRKCATKQTC